MAQVELPKENPVHVDKSNSAVKKTWSAVLIKATTGTVGAMALLSVGIFVGVNYGNILAFASGQAPATNAVAQKEQVAQQERPTGEDTSHASNPLPASTPENPFQQHIRQAGITTCSSLVSTLGGMLTLGTTYGVQSSWIAETPNDHAFQSVVGMTYDTKDHRGAAAGMVFAAPNSKTLCEGAMLRVVPFEQPCSTLPALLPKGSAPLNRLEQVQLYTLGDGGTSMMIPSGNTCVVVTVATGSVSGKP